jgi:hypothetical protein
MGDRFVILVLYVDDILLIGDNMELVRDTKSLLSKAFDMKDLGVVHYCLGIEVKRDRKNRKIWLSQKKYIENILNEFGMETCKVVKTPFQVGVKLSTKMCPKTHEEKKYIARLPYARVVGSLMYAMVCTRLDIAHSVGVVSIFMVDPRKEHWMVVKRIFRYLQGTKDYALCYQDHGNDIFYLHGFVDVDWVGDVDKRKSTSAYVFTLFGGK